MRHYPMFLDLRGRRAVVVGGGPVAERKVRKLLRAGARVRVISPELTPGLARLAAANRICVARRRYRTGDLKVGEQRPPWRAPILVFAATHDASAQQTVRSDAAAAGALVNRADSAEDSDFIVPASFTHGDLHIAISTSGKDPSLARMLRIGLEAELKKGKRQKAKVKRQR
jgi:siroheme synthase-like protein